MQEYTRLATGLSRASSGLDSPEEFRSAAAMIVSPLIERIDGILALENAEFLPKLARRWHKALATIHRGPPDLDYSYYYYGLLDCLSQLAMLSDHTVLGDNILEKMRYLIFESVVPEFRWKAVSHPNFPTHRGYHA